MERKETMIKVSNHVYYRPRTDIVTCNEKMIEISFLSLRCRTIYKNINTELDVLVGA